MIHSSNALEILKKTDVYVVCADLTPHIATLIWMYIIYFGEKIWIHIRESTTDLMDLNLDLILLNSMDLDLIYI